MTRARIIEIITAHPDTAECADVRFDEMPGHATIDVPLLGCEYWSEDDKLRILEALARTLAEIRPCGIRWALTTRHGTHVWEMIRVEVP